MFVVAAGLLFCFRMIAARAVVAVCRCVLLRVANFEKHQQKHKLNSSVIGTKKRRSIQ